MINRGITVFIVLMTIIVTINPLSIATVNNSDDFDEEMMGLMEQACFPSLYACIIKNNTIVWSKGYGFYDIKNKKEPNNDTIYLAGSISKTVTATAIMQLWEKGLFDLDDDVNQYLPYSLRNPKYPETPITFRMLLAHQSSLSRVYIGLFILFSVLHLPIEKLPEYILPGGKIYNPLSWKDFPPGEKFTYSCLGYEVLGTLVEYFSNQSYIEYCSEHIFQPLKMYNTSFIPDDLDKERIAIPYVHFANRYIPLPHYTNYNFAAGGLRTTVFDLAKYLIAYMNQGEYDGVRILENETVDQMLSYQYNHSSYGLGWRMFLVNTENNTRRIGHSGAVPGGISSMFYLSSNNVGVIYMANQYLFFKFKYFHAWYTIISLLFEKAMSL